MSDLFNSVLYAISQGLGVPVMVVLILLMAVTLVCVGSMLVEFFTERNHYKVVMPLLIDALEDCPNDSPDRIISVVEESGMLRRQKNALSTVASYMDMPHDALTSLAKTFLTEEADYYSRKVAFTDTVAKVAPMFGLMGTLIPLGPGITALSTGDLTTLSSSLSIAFDTTVAGLVSAAVCVIITKIRERWYRRYLAATEAAMNCILEKADFLHGFREPNEAADLGGELSSRFQAARAGLSQEQQGRGGSKSSGKGGSRDGVSGGRQNGSCVDAGSAGPDGKEASSW